MAEGTISTKVAVEKEGVRKKFETLLAEFEMFKVNRSESGDALDLLILDLGDDIKQDLRTVETVMRKGKVGHVFLTGDNLDANVLLQAMRIGVKEFFPQPLDEEEVRAALGRLSLTVKPKAGGDRPRRGRIITFFGSKGGVGTTTLAVNMAASLAAKGKGYKTALVDMHVILGDIPLFFDIKPGFNWGEILKNIHRLDATLLDNVLTHHKASGVHILPAPARLDEGLHTIQADVVDRLLETMRDAYDYTILDCGFVMGASLAKILEMADRFFVVTLLTLPCLTNTRKVIQAIETVEQGAVKTKLRIVVNRFAKKTSITLPEAEKGIGHKIFWRVPDDYKRTMGAINQGKTLKQVAPRSPIASSIEGLAESETEQGMMSGYKKWKLY